ncbi:unknown protein [Desulfotalea psychrophila LSv54]|uniref:Uncharacterized protein n=1 Tax=Desulfotalea psychrophila (strain LSv54 / DSM 12343) TaxID=177439 RepID=Q6AMP5_DESPS|nr:unknown protein [Desulfotalea psychrophila LSv54]
MSRRLYIWTKPFFRIGAEGSCGYVGGLALPLPPPPPRRGGALRPAPFFMTKPVVESGAIKSCSPRLLSKIYLVFHVLQVTYCGSIEQYLTPPLGDGCSGVGVHQRQFFECQPHFRKATPNALP